MPDNASWILEVPSKLFQKRKAEAAKRAARLSTERADRLRVLVVAEGYKTEPNYLDEFIKLDGLGRVEPFLTRDHKTGPMILLAQAKRILSLDRDYDFAYVVSDRDEFDDFEQAKNAAGQIRSKPEIKFIYSDPCVEFWFILHFELYDAPITRHQALQMIRNYIPNYEKGNRDIAKILYGQTDQAIERSIEILERCTATQTSCPSTNFHELIIEIRSKR